jgi:signal transduction histidine kinase/CheY-like chemotaxis protein/HPt (histidine-containing phosphotransfer) domain-containing protein
VSRPARAFEQQVDEIRTQVRSILAASAAWPDAGVRGQLERLRDQIDAVGDDTTRLLAAIEREDQQLDEVLDVLFAVARLDFSQRAPIRGDRPLDALAAVANMLSEEIELAQREMNEARAAAETATEAKSRFLANMSHEIRTPLTALLGFADLLTSPVLSESDRLNYAMIIRRNGEHLLSVINDILDLSRVEAGRLMVEQIDCPPAQIFAEVASLMRLRAQAHGLRFAAELTTPVPATVRSDPTRLRQILLNLVGNAVKFTREGQVTMRLALDGEGRLCFEVEDTGPGIAPDVVAELFQPFQQADLSMTRRFGGSGLGLAISRALATALDGTIEVETALGRGSTFRLRVPITVAGDGRTITRLEDAGLAHAPGAAGAQFTGTALVVEDGLDNQVLIVTLLRGWGLQVAVARDGEVALQRVAAADQTGRAYDVVLMDMQMPILDGYQATAALRASGYRGPIVALTAHAMAGERERCLAAGCDEYVGKPIDRAQLVAALARHLPSAAAAIEAGDGTSLHSSFADDPAMQPIITRFVAALPARVTAIRAEAHAPGSTALARLVHQLKGAAGGYGFAEITTAAAAVEHALRTDAAHAEVLRAIDLLEAVSARARAGTP